jgi:hypothetical protein
MPRLRACFDAVPAYHCLPCPALLVCCGREIFSLLFFFCSLLVVRTIPVTIHQRGTCVLVFIPTIKQEPKNPIPKRYLVSTETNGVSCCGPSMARLEVHVTVIKHIERYRFATVSCICFTTILFLHIKSITIRAIKESIGSQ